MANPSKILYFKLKVKLKSNPFCVFLVSFNSRNILNRGRSRGFGFVEMTNDTEGQKAIDELNGAEYDHKVIAVSIARPRTERQSNGGYRDRNSNSRRYWSGDQIRGWLKNQLFGFPANLFYKFYFGCLITLSNEVRFILSFRCEIRSFQSWSVPFLKQIY